MFVLDSEPSTLTRDAGVLTPTFEVMADLAEGPRKAATESGRAGTVVLYEYKA